MNIKWMRRLIPRVLIVGVLLASVLIPILPQNTVHAAPADAYWVGNGGNTSNATGHWATVSGGAPGAGNTPDQTTNIHFDSNSFSLAGQTVTVDATLTFKNMDWTGATNSPTFNAASQTLNIYGNLTAISAMTWNSVASTIMVIGSCSLTTNGISIPSTFIYDTSADRQLILLDNANVGGVQARRGTFTSNSFNITAFGITDGGSGSTRTITLGNSTLNLSNFQFNSGVTTITPNTANITINGTGRFDGGTSTWGVVTLSGTSHVVTGTVTNLTAFNLNPSGAQTITATGATVNVTTPTRIGTGQISLTGGTINDTNGGVNSFANMTLLNSTVTGATWNATGGSVDSGGNTGWIFPLNISTAPSSNISMDKNGVASGNFSGRITDMGGQATVNVWHDYGLTNAYGSQTANTTYSTTNFTGTKFHSIPNNLIPAQTYHDRFAITSGANTTFGSDDNFTLTMPVTITNSAVNISMNKDGVTSGNFSGNATSMGVATTSYGLFRYGLTGAYGLMSASNVTVGGVGNYQVPIAANLTPGATYHNASVLQNGSVNVTGGDSTFTLTLPSVTTGTVTQSGNQATLNGNVTNMGVASSTYRYFEWWQSGVPVQTTPLGTSVATGAYNSTITFDTLKEVSYRAVTQVGSVKSYGATLTFSSGTIATSGNLFWTILPLIIAGAVIIFCAGLFAKTLDPGLLVGGVVGGLLAYVVTVVLVNAFFR